MTKTRVLVVDDSALVRRIVSGILNEDADLEVVGTAANGRIALAKLESLNPDLITLDVEMPELDGLRTLAAIRKRSDALPVVMLSSLTERGAESTLDCLFLGANDYVTKPTATSDVEGSRRRLRDELVPKIKALCRKRGRVETAIRMPSMLPADPQRASRLRVLAIGASTGGPNALTELLSRFPRDFPIPILIVQHMPPLFTRSLAERLSAKSAIRVEECSGGEELEAGVAWLAPGDFHLEVVREEGHVRVRTHRGAFENSCRPSVDVLFRSVARVFGAGAMAVVLTGMGQDGLRGCREIRAAGGKVLAQDESSSVVWGMPGAVVEQALADVTMPPAALGVEILRRLELAGGLHG